MMYRRDGLVFMTLNDPAWGASKVARVLPSPDGGLWGSFLELAGTEWEGFIDVVSSDALDRALRGDCTPLMREGLRDPKGCLKRAPLTKTCSDAKGCASFKKEVCQTTHKNTPECFSFWRDIPTSVRVLLSAWKEGYYVIREREKK